VADQVLVSAAHFAVGLSVARSGSSAALALFGLGFVIIATASDAHRAVIWLPMTQEADGRQYRAARRLSVVLGAGSGAVALVSAWLLARAGLQDWAALALSLAVVLPLLFAQEIQRRIQFSSLRPDRALLADVIYAAAALAGILWLPSFGGGAGAPAVRALLTLGMAAVSAGLVGAWLLRGMPETEWSITQLAGRYRPTAQAYVLNAGLVFASQRLSMLVIAGILGFDALANVEAARLLTAPLMVAATGLAALAVPMVSHTLRRDGPRVMRAKLDRITTWAVLLASVYGVILFFGMEALSNFAFGRQFENGSTLALLFCGIAASSLIATALVAPVGLAGRADAVPRARIPGVALVTIACVPAALLLDEHAILGLVLIEGILTAGLLRRTVERLYAVAP
jgi:O-antigen/teichoic acid export membrane protein